MISYSTSYNFWKCLVRPGISWLVLDRRFACNPNCLSVNMLEIVVLAGCGTYAIKGYCSLCSGEISVCNTGEVKSVFVEIKDKDYTECSPLFRRTVFQPNLIENWCCPYTVSLSGYGKWMRAHDKQTRSCSSIGLQTSSEAIL